MKGENISTRLRHFAAQVLRLCRSAEHLDALVREANELVAILTASIKTAKERELTPCAEGRWRMREAGEPENGELGIPTE